MKFASLLLLMSLFSCSCATQKAKTDVLMPTALLLWEGEQGVEGDTLRGIIDGVEDGELLEDELLAEDESLIPTDADNLRNEAVRIDVALELGDTAMIQRSDWLWLEPWARRGVRDRVDDLEIGPGVAVSLLERISNFSDTLQSIKE